MYLFIYSITVDDLVNILEGTEDTLVCNTNLWKLSISTIHKHAPAYMPGTGLTYICVFLWQLWLVINTVIASTYRLKNWELTWCNLLKLLQLRNGRSRDKFQVRHSLECKLFTIKLQCSQQMRYVKESRVMSGTERDSKVYIASGR